MKPILFNTENVIAIEDGRKTQTRRVFPLKYYPVDSCVDLSGAVPEIRGEYQFLRLKNGHEYGGPINCPCGRAGEVLYVRETFQCEGTTTSYNDDGTILYSETYYAYKERTERMGWGHQGKWSPSIHMPREAARIFLKVADVRVERLQDITDEGCEAEGIDLDSLYEIDKEVGFPNRKDLFEHLWNSINAKRGYGWNTNPFVWVYSFKKITKVEAEKALQEAK